MALISPPYLREPSYPGFPPRCGMTFGEVVSSYNMFGNAAAKRHNYMTHHQETRVPDDRATIYEKVKCLRDNEKDLLKSVSSSSRGLLTPRWSVTRSRTPSPWMQRRPRSLPATPRASTPNVLRRSDSRDRYFKDAGVDLGGALYDSHSKLDVLHQRVESGRYGGGGTDTFAVENVAAETFALGSDGARGRGLPSYLPTASAMAPSLTSGGAIGASAGALPSASVPDSLGHFPTTASAQRKSPQTLGAGYDRFSSRDVGGGSLGHPRYPLETYGRKPPQADARAASFVRLNSFLLRTHVTSLVSALAEDGWLETWEKERLCSQAREDSPSWAQAFFRSYMRFMETEDVPTFVASLRSQIV